MYLVCLPQYGGIRKEKKKGQAEEGIKRRGKKKKKKKKGSWKATMLARSNRMGLSCRLMTSQNYDGWGRKTHPNFFNVSLQF